MFRGSVSRRGVSVVIPCFNGRGTIERTVASAFEADPLVDGVIVVDDGSTDGTCDFVSKMMCRYSRLNLIRGENRGASFARNLGLNAVSSEYVKFLDSDDYLIPGALSLEVDAMENLHESAAVYGAAVMMDGNGQRLGRMSAWQLGQHGRSQLADLASVGKKLLVACPLHRTSCVRAVGGFDTRLSSRQEWDLHLRLAFSGVRFVSLGHDSFCCVQHDSPSRISISSQTADRKATSLLRVATKFLLVSDADFRREMRRRATGVFFEAARARRGSALARAAAVIALNAI